MTVLEYYHEMNEKRETLPYEIDGIVIKVDRLDLQAGWVKSLGAHGGPWPSSSSPSRKRPGSLDIVAQVGRTGALTPVAMMQPVQVGRCGGQPGHPS